MIYFDNDILSIFPSPFVSLFFIYLVGKSDENGTIRTSLREISEETGWGINPIRNAISELTNLNTIHTESTHRGSVITVCVIDACKDKSTKSTHSLHTIHTRKTSIAKVNDEFTFDYVWDLYKKKDGRCLKLENKWNSMSYEDRKKAVEFIPAYVALTEEMYRKKFQTFLNQRTWENENIYTNGISVPYGSFNPKLVEDKELFKQFVINFNNKIRGSGVKEVDLRNGLTEKRRILFNIAYCLHFHQMKAVVENAIKNPRLNGSTGFAADFDYIFKPDNFLRIYEGY
jgi:hypothetical protein